MTTEFAYIPSPSQGVWDLGPIPLRGYAMCILVGIGLAIVIGQRRYKARGGDPVMVVDIATWAVPFGVIGGRVYHVITTPKAYFGAGGEPVKVFYIWQGGLGIWGAVVLGGVGAWIACRRLGVKLPPFADAIAPGIVAAQAIGRVGNWFNNELYGKATDQPWGLKIYDWDTSAGKAVVDAAGHPVVKGIYQPTFLYESLWDILAAVLLILADRRWKLGHGRVFALYMVIYSVGRGAIETLRIDEADHILGLRLNVWTSMVVFIAGLSYLIVSAVLRPGRETDVYRLGVAGAPRPATADGPEISGESEVGPSDSKNGETTSSKTGSSTRRGLTRRRSSSRGSDVTSGDSTSSQVGSSAADSGDVKSKDKSANTAG